MLSFVDICIVLETESTPAMQIIVTITIVIIVTVNAYEYLTKGFAYNDLFNPYKTP